ncbi:MarR family transcriptional regulator [Mangrovactinospora gilvigrisea]|uniref:MarR family transcriptional regulator n=1 Tax=Mangrovactinospora gilvigrisea TaxID=1428644 RepID=A0A1J7BAN5_9ACTN|nr:MarR family transcriptional regulator [Mangrovactinospora gilvigrisea]OIV35661.1 MarR family transcriptional regulator [Mangrovactinospora gilvigrisea]
MRETAEGARGSDWLDDQEQRVWRAHLAVGRLLNHRMGRDLAAFGLSLNDYEILVNLSEAPERRLRMTELADATLLSKSRLSHQITRMEKAGLVRRERCLRDGRGLEAVLTEHGGQVLARVAPEHVRGVRRHFFDRLSAGDVDALERALVPLAEYLETVTDVRT